MRFFAQNILLGIFFTLPFFAFAQTATTTQADPSAADREKAFAESSRVLNNFLNDQMKAVPKTSDIRANAVRDFLEITTSPRYPGPLEMVQVSIQSYLTDLNKATITWTLDGKVMDRGVGRKTFSFKNSPSGKLTRLSISITTNTGETTVKSLSWNPVGITTLWEADTYTPPFYRGKPLLSPQARVRAIAIPDNTGAQGALGAGNFVYTWEQNGEVAAESSGYGKNSFSFVGPKPYDTADVRVRTSSIDDTIKSEARIKLSLTNPFILFYEDHPLLGVLHSTSLLPSLTLSKKEFSVSAEPYFFSNEASEVSTIKYDWRLNNRAIQNPGRVVTLRNERGEKGDSLLTLSMQGLKQTFQTGGQSLLIHFTTNESSRPTF